MSTNKTLKLKFPIVGSEGTETTELTFRRPKAKDLRGIDLLNLNLDGILDIAKKVLENDAPLLIDEIDMADVVPLSELIADFLESGPESGKTT